MVLLASLVVVGIGSGNLFTQAADQATKPDTAGMEKYVKKLIINAKWGDKPGEFAPPTPHIEDPEYHILMVISPQGYIYISDLERSQKRVNIFNTEGTFIKSHDCFRFAGWAYDFEVDRKGNVFAIEDDFFSGISVYNSQGKIVGEYPAQDVKWPGYEGEKYFGGGRLVQESTGKIRALIELWHLEEDNKKTRFLHKTLDLAMENRLEVNESTDNNAEPSWDSKVVPDGKRNKWVIERSRTDGAEFVTKIGADNRILFRVNKPVTHFNIQGQSWWLFGGDVVAFDRKGNFYTLNASSDGIRVYKWGPSVR